MSAVAPLEVLPQDSQTQALSVAATSIEENAQSLMVEGDAGMGLATEMLGNIAKAKKAIEERRKFLVGPLNDQVKRINEWFKSIVAPLESADNTLRGKVLAYQRELDRKRREEEDRLRQLAAKEQARLERQAEKKGIPAPPPMPLPVIAGPAKTTHVGGASATISKVWDFEIADESQIPREYLTVNESKIRAVVKAGIRNIPGVRIFEREQLAVRSG